jgi:hypothetical protein
VTASRDQLAARQAPHQRRPAPGLRAGSVAAAAGMDEPLAQGRDDRHTPARMTVGEQLGTGVVEEPQVLRRHDRLPYRPAIPGRAGLGTPAAIGHGHRTIPAERDRTVPAIGALSLIGRVGGNLKDQMPDSARSKRGRIPA